MSSARLACLLAASTLAACGVPADSSRPQAPAVAPPVAGAAKTKPPTADDPTGGTNTPYCDRATRPEIGVAEVSRRALSERSWEITLASKAMQRDEHITVTLPVNYDASGRTRYPVLYLLHGSLDNHLAWWNNGAEAVIGERQLIVVTPNDSANGSYTDWYGSFTGSGETPPKWESFHVREVIPFVEANFPVRSDAAGRSVAGLSSGGHGAMKYAAANPGLFGSAGSFSGAVNTTYSFPAGTYSYPLTEAGLGATSLIPTQGPIHHCAFGDAVVQEAYWKDNDPTYLAENLKGIPLWLSTGDGTPGPYDAVPYADPVELQVSYMTLAFAAQLDRHAIPWTNDLYGAGTHSWPYWLRDLGLFLNWLEPQFQRSALAPPAKFAYRSARPEFSAWDWHFAIHRKVQEFVYLDDVHAGGFTVAGSGVLDVLSAPLYLAGAAYEIAVGEARSRATADAEGRLLFSVDLGPAHAENQRDFSDAAADAWTHRQVRITSGVTP